MRPVEKRIWTDVNGNEIDKVYLPYGSAKDDLIDNIGKYCSFCEVPIPPKSSLAVEHILPKSLPKYSHLINSWSNFLLGCPNCNSTKGTDDYSFGDIHLPHRNNTFLSFQIEEGGLIQLSDKLLNKEQARAEKILLLVGLDRRPGHSKYSRKDDRWQNRYETWNLAQKYLTKYHNTTTDVDTIIDLAISKGFFFCLDDCF